LKIKDIEVFHIIGLWHSIGK